MRRLAALGTFIWDFVIGDDWRIAAGVAIALALTALLAGSVTAWWILPVAVAGLLVFSVQQAARSHRAAAARPPADGGSAP